MVNKEPAQRTTDAKTRSAALKRRATGFSLGVLLAAFGAVAASSTPGTAANPAPDPLAIAAPSAPPAGTASGAPAARVQPSPTPQARATGSRPSAIPPASSLTRPGGAAVQPVAPVRRSRSRMS